MAKFVLFQDDDYNQYRWTLRDDRGNVMAQSPVGYMTFEECDKAVRTVKNVAGASIIDDQTPPPARRRTPKRST